MRFPRSLKTVLSLLVLLLGLVLIFSDWWRNENLLTERTTARMEREARTAATRLAGIMQHCFRNGQPRVAELEMAYTTLLPDLVMGIVVDDRGIVRYSTRLQWQGREVDETPMGAVMDRPRTANTNANGFVLMEDGRLLSVYPFYVGHGASELGFVALSYDIGQALLKSRSDAFWESVVRACQLAAACLILWLALDLLVTHRVDRLLGFVKGVREGRNVPNPETGGDELGTIARAFDESVSKLRETEARLLEASEEERRRVGRDIHDDVCQRIAAAQLKCGILSSVLGREGSNHAVMAVDVAKELQEAVKVTRGFARGLCPVRVGSEGLGVALQELAADMGRSFGIKFEIENSIGEGMLVQRVENHVFRILQELMTNAAKHAKATRVTVRLFLVGPSMRLEVENDGRPFGSEAAVGDGLGLRFVDQRLRALGGELRYQDRPGDTSGTIAVCTVALAKQHFVTESPPIP